MTNCLQTLYLEISKIHLNIRSLNKNCSELYHFLHLLDHDFDVVVLSEIWSYNISFYRNLLPNYTLFLICKQFVIYVVGCTQLVHQNVTVIRISQLISRKCAEYRSSILLNAFSTAI